MLKPTQNIFWTIQLILITLLVYGVLTGYPSLGEVFWTSKPAILTIGVGCVLFLILFFQLIINPPLKVQYPDILLIAYVGYVGLNILFTTPTFLSSNDYLELITLAGFYFVIRHFLSSSPQTFQTAFVLIFVILGGLQAVLGLQQLYGFEPSNHNLYKVTGDFFNPGPFSGFLLCSFPLGLSLYLFRKPHDFRSQVLGYVGLGAFLLILLMLPSTLSRASWVAGVIGVGLIGWVRYDGKKFVLSYLNNPVKKIVAITVSGVLLISLAVGLFHFKKESAIGRLLSYRVSISAWMEQPVMGAGYKLFAPAFGAEQIEFFRTEDRSEELKMVAGHGEYAFNEFLMILVEQGIIGLVLFLLLLGSVLIPSFARIVRSGQSIDPIVLGVVASLISLLVFACFSYPFSIPVIFLSFFLLLAVVASKNSSRVYTLTKGILNSVITLVLIIGVGTLSFLILRIQHTNWKNQQVWEEAGYFEDMQEYELAKETFDEIADAYQYNGGFLFRYGQVLRLSGHCEQAVDVLNRASRFTTDPYLFNSLGNCYQELGEYEKAEEAYYKSNYLIPHKFYPVYLLAKLHEERGEIVKSKSMASKLLSMPVKISSPAIEEMKKEMQGLIDRD